MAGNLRYELDLQLLIRDERKEVKRQVDFYLRHRGLIQFGAFFRLVSPFAGNRAGWMVVSPDRKQSVAWNIDVLNPGNAPRKYLRLQGLAPKANYAVTGSKEIFGGDYLHAAGLAIPTPKHDFQSTVWELTIVAQPGCMHVRLTALGVPSKTFN